MTHTTARPGWSCAALALTLVTALCGLVTPAFADPSPTGRTPKLLWTPERQAVWNRLRAENHPWWQSLKYYADRSGTSGGRYIDIGEWPTMAYQVTGDAAYAQTAWNILSGQFGNSGADWLREHFAEFVWMYDWLYPALSSSQRQTFRDALNRWADLVRTSDWGGRMDDSDQATGDYFGLVFLGLATQGENSRANEFLSAAGGLDATGTNRETMRNTIKDYVQMSEGGIWIESSHYNAGTLQLLLMGAEGVRTATGSDHFPEVTALLPQLALAQMHELTPDIGQSYQWGDVQDPRSMRMFRRMPLLGQLCGLLQNNSAIGPYIHDLRNDLHAIVNQVDPDANADEADPRAFTLYNPYAASQDWHGAASGLHYAPGSGIMFVHDGWGSNNSFFGAHMSPRLYVDHEVWHLGNFQLRRNGEWAITHPIGYDANEGHVVNAMRFAGFSMMREAKGPVAQEFGPGGSYAYLAGTTGGSWYSPGTWNPPARFLHEWTRSLFYLPSSDDKSDTIVVFDRTNAQRPQDLNAYDGYSSADRSRIEGSQLKEWIIHMPVSPSLTSDAISWTAPGSQQVRVNTLLPAGQQRSVIDERQDGLPGYVNDSEKKFHVRIRPSTARQWDTFLNVVQVSSGSPSLSNSLLRSAGGEAEGALIQRGGHNDAVVMFGAVQGPSLPFPDMDANWKLKWDNPPLFDQLKTVRLLRAGYALSFNAGTPATECYLLDLDPSRGWKITVDGGAETTLAVSSQGVGRLTVSGSGAHTLTVRADGAPAPAPAPAPSPSPSPTSDTTPPAVSITQPAQGAVLSSSTRMVATASDNVGVVGVQFKLDGQSLGEEDPSEEFSDPLDIATITNGTHVLTAVARDAAGNTTTSAPVAITVNNGTSAPPPPPPSDATPPTVSIVQPATGSVLSGQATVVATASDNVGVQGVQFQVNSVSLGPMDTTNTYSTTLDTTTLANGTYALAAVATDTAGNTTTSAPVAITVNNGTSTPPPAPGTTYYVGPNGADDLSTGRGTTPANPWRTIGFGVANVPDDNVTLAVLDGMYTNPAVSLSRVFSTRLTIKAQNAYKAILTNTGGNSLFRAFGGANYTIEGFVLGPSQSVTMIQVAEGSRNFTFRNNILRDSYNNDIMKINDRTTDIVIAGNVFYNRGGSDEDIDLNAILNATVENNIFFSDYAGSSRALPAARSNVVVKNSPCDWDSSFCNNWSKNVTIRRNIFLNWEGAASANFIRLGEDGTPAYEAQDVLIENNLMVGNSANTIEAPIGIEASKNVTVRNNTITGNLPARGYVVSLRASGYQTQGVTIANNIWADPTGTMSIFSVGSDSGISQVTFTRNLFWNNGNGLPGSADGGLEAADDAQRIVQNPQLPVIGTVVLPRYDTTTGKFLSGQTTIDGEFKRLAALYGVTGTGSPARDAANAPLAAADDLLGTARTASPDLGATEATGGAADTTAPVITGIQAVEVSVTEATIIWNTGEPASTQLEYGTSSSYGSQTPVDASLLTAHQVHLTGLSENTLYHFRVKSADGAGNVASSADQTVQTNLAPPPPPEPEPANTAPVLAPIGDKQVAENSLLTFTLSATDAESDPLAFSADDLPSGATLTGNVFSWTPDYAQAGAVPITFTVSDGNLTDSEAITITVTDTNRPPTVNAGTDQVVTLPAAASLDGTVTDADLPTGGLGTLWTKVSGPGTVTFGNAAAVDTTASCSVEGTYVLRLTANDGVVSVSDDLTVIANPSGSTFSATLEAETMPIKTVGEPVTYGWNIWSNGYIEGTLTVPSTGEYDLRVIAKGTPALNSWPLMELRIDGVAVATFTVGAADWSGYSMHGSIAAGTHRIAVAFINDVYAPPEDRNLYVDKVQVGALLTPPPPPTAITLEAETMPIKTVGEPVTNGWNLWSNGYVQDTVEFPSSLSYQFQVVARGTYAGRKWPNMELRIDGKAVKSFTVNSTSWKTFTVNVTVAAGSRRIAVAFTNDYYQSGQDRNLYVDKVTIKPLP